MFPTCRAYHGHLASLRALNSNHETAPDGPSDGLYDVSKVGVPGDRPADAQNHTSSSLRQALLPADHTHGRHTNAVREIVKQQGLKGKKVLTLRRGGGLVGGEVGWWDREVGWWKWLGEGWRVGCKKLKCAGEVEMNTC